jgi:predicted RND superfamily exporter protein
MYEIPSNHEKNFIFSYLPKLDSAESNNILASYVDDNMQIARVSARLHNLNTKEIEKLNKELKTKIDSIFPPDKYQVDITGTSVVFLKGSGYMTSNLLYSLLVAIIIISIIMYLLFNSFKMVLISMVPNILPQVMTAALMGFLKIDIKPSTIIIYSIALGISVDAAIHLLSRYRQQLKLTNWDIKLSLFNALQETSVGMVYSGIVLILGFGVFTLSSFGGTQSLGFLVSFTLTVAMFSNLILLPSLILRFDKSGTTKAFAKPVFEFLEESDDDANDDAPEIIKE